jgi:hypothetical protein
MTAIQRDARLIGGGFSGEALASAGVVVLAILGLANVYTNLMLPIAAIVMGFALLVKGGTIASRFGRFVRESGNDRESRLELGAGMSAELLGGAAGITLGVLALIGLSPMTLMEVAALVFGGTLLFGGGETYRISQLRSGNDNDTGRLAGESAGAIEAMAGIAAVVLGILALTGTAHPMTLVLTAFLIVGAATLMSGLAVMGRMTRAF